MLSVFLFHCFSSSSNHGLDKLNTYNVTSGNKDEEMDVMCVGMCYVWLSFVDGVNWCLVNSVSVCAEIEERTRRDLVLFHKHEHFHSHGSRCGVSTCICACTCRCIRICS